MVGDDRDFIVEARTFEEHKSYVMFYDEEDNNVFAAPTERVFTIEAIREKS